MKKAVLNGVLPILCAAMPVLAVVVSPGGMLFGGPLPEQIFADGFEDQVCQLSSECDFLDTAPTCDSAATCQGSQTLGICLDSICLPEPVETDVACGSGVLSQTCGLYLPVFCTGQESQPVDQAALCATSCNSNADCDSGAVCSESLECVPEPLPPTLMAVGPFAVTPNIRIDVPDGNDDLLFLASDPDSTTLTIDDADGLIVTSAMGLVTVNTSTGAFSYDPPPGFTSAAAPDSFQYRVCDDTALCSDPVTIQFNVQGTMVWFIDASASPGGDGRLQSPYPSLTAFNTANGTLGGPQVNDAVFLAGGAYAGGISLLNGQRLFGQGMSGTSFDSEILGGSAAAYSIDRPQINQALPSISASGGAAGFGVALASDNSLRGFNVSDTASAGISGSGFGTLTVSEVSITDSGPILDLEIGTMDIQFTGLSTTVAGTTAIRVRTSGGSLTVDAGGGMDTAIAGAGAGLLVQNASASFDFGNSSIDSTGVGISLINNAGASITFDSLDINTNNATGLLADNGGTLSVTGTGNQVTTGAGTAIDISNTTIGPAGITFESISVDGATNGIALTNTGTDGGFTITGDGSNNANGSGGAISNTTGHGIVLSDTNDVRISSLDLVSPGDAAGEHGVSASNLRGDANAIRGMAISGIAQANGDGIRVVNSNVDLGSLTIADTSIIGAANGNDGLFVNGLGSSVMAVTVESCTFDSLWGDGVHVSAENSSSVLLDLSGSTFSTTQETTGDVSRLTLVAANTATLTGLISNSAFLDTGAQPPNLPVAAIGVIDAVANDSSSMVLRLNGNEVNGIEQETGMRFVGDDNTADMDIIVDGNEIHDVQMDDAIFVYVRDATRNADITIRNNLIGTLGAVAEHGIQVRSHSRNTVVGGGPNDNVPVVTRLSITGNTVVNSDSLSEGIDLESESDSPDGSSASPASNLEVLMTNNTVSNALGAEVEVDAEDGPGVGTGFARICLDMIGNTLEGGSGVLDDLDEASGAVLDVVQTSAPNLVSANAMSLVDVVGSPNFGAVPVCTAPQHTVVPQ